MDKNGIVKLFLAVEWNALAVENLRIDLDNIFAYLLTLGGREFPPNSPTFARGLPHCFYTGSRVGRLCQVLGSELENEGGISQVRVTVSEPSGKDISCCTRLCSQIINISAAVEAAGETTFLLENCCSFRVLRVRLW